jgi:2-haloacid dehalogenase
MRADNGEASFTDLAGEAGSRTPRMPGVCLAHYVSRFISLTRVEHAVPGSWETLSDRQARAACTPLHAITNWSAETWPERADGAAANWRICSG